MGEFVPTVGGGGREEPSWAGWRGRAREWRTVTGLLDAACAGRGGVLLVEGPSGIGKSRLLAEALDTAAARNFVIAHGDADELRRLVPFAPLMAALGESAQTLGMGQEMTSPTADDRRLWLVDQLRNRLEDRLARGAMLVALDDLQWADPGTLFALRLLLPELDSYPLVWMFARTTGGPDTGIGRLYDVLEREGARRLALEPLDDRAVTEAATDVLGAAPGSELLALAAGAGGNPFLLVELLKGLRDEGAIEVADGRAHLASEESRPLPHRIQTVVRNRLAPLSPPARRMLQVGAVLGRSFSLDDLADLLDERANRLLPALEETLAAQIVVPAGDVLAFRHDLLWQAVTDGIPLPVRRWLHLQAGELLLRRGGSAVPAAAHFMVHARPGDTRALAGLDQAAREVLPSSPRIAAELAMRALELTVPSDPARFDRMVTAIGALTAAGRLPESAELARSGLGSASQDQAARLRYELALILSLSGRPVEAANEIENLLAEPELSAELRDRSEWTWFVALILQQRFWRGRQRAETIVAAPDRHGDGALAGALDLLMHVAWAEGRVADGLDHIREAARVSGRTIGAHSIGPRLSLALCLQRVRHLEEAETVLQAAEEAIEAMGHALHAPSAAFVRAHLHFAAGRLDDAVAEAEAGLEIANEFGTNAFALAGHEVLAIVALRRGDLPAAARHVERYHARASQGMAFPPGAGLWPTALVAEARDGPERAKEILDADCPDVRMWRWHLVVEPNLAAWATRIALATGDRAQAATIADTAERLAGGNPDFPVFACAAAHARGILHDDVAALGQAQAGSTDPWARASAAEDLGVLRSGTDRRAAVHDLDEALEGYERMGALRDAARVRARLRELGVRRRHWTQAQRPTTGWAGLTDTERSVAMLVAEGLTNRQVATRLFVSPHTVKFHLRQVFQKLAIGSRVELARVAAEARPGAAEAADRPPA